MVESQGLSEEPKAEEPTAEVLQAPPAPAAARAGSNAPDKKGLFDRIRVLSGDEKKVISVLSGDEKKVISAQLRKRKAQQNELSR